MKSVRSFKQACSANIAGLSAALLVTTGLAVPLTAVATVAADSPATSNTAAPTFYLRDCHANQTAKVGQLVYANCTVGTEAVPASNILVELNIYDSAGNLARHKVIKLQNFNAYDQKQYAAAWRPKQAGTYTFEVNVFSQHRQTIYLQHDVNTITVT